MAVLLVVQAENRDERNVPMMIQLETPSKGYGSMVRGSISR